jgi:hypothetical protein
LIARFHQNKHPEFKRLILACADNFLTAEPDFRPDITGRPPDVEAGTIGNVIGVLNAAYKISGDGKYLARSTWFCSWAVEKFWTDGSPLPRASVNENIYSAPSRSDTLVMSLLQTWLLREKRDGEVVLIATDRS